MYSMLGFWGMRKLEKLIDERARHGDPLDQSAIPRHRANRFAQRSGQRLTTTFAVPGDRSRYGLAWRN